MTTIANLDKQGQASIGITLTNTDNFTFDVSVMNTVIVAYNTANSTNYPIWDTVSDNIEKFLHFLDVFFYVQNLILGNNTFNIKFTSIQAGTQTFGTRTNLNSRSITKAYPFTSSSDIFGDSDSLG